MADEQWVIQTYWQNSGDIAFWGFNGMLAGARADAKRYPSAEAAYAAAEDLKQSDRINEYTVVEVSRPPHGGIVGSTGRA